MKKLLVICGATATGKTSLGISLAKKFKGEIISGDSRQVYQKMDIGTGKDIPKGAIYKNSNNKTGGYYKISNIRIWGYDLVSPKEEFSVAQYTKIAREVIKDIHKRNKLPILVGGTGFYIKSVVEGIDTVEIPQNKALRNNLKKLPKDELLEKLAILDSSKAGSLNQSDKKNPRRLIRAIEIAIWKLDNMGTITKDEKLDYDTLFVGLSLPEIILFEKIKKRVLERVNGVKEEISNLLKGGVKWSDQAMSSFGYKQWKDFFEGSKTEKEVIYKWLLGEKQYSKRQITWFKKYKDINWFDISKPKWKENVEKLVKKWYSSD